MKNAPDAASVRDVERQPALRTLRRGVRGRSCSALLGGRRAGILSAGLRRLEFRNQLLGLLLEGVATVLTTQEIRFAVVFDLDRRSHRAELAMGDDADFLRFGQRA